MNKQILLLGFIIACSLSSYTQSISLTPYVSALNYPIDIRHCGDDRLFVAERGGRIRVVNPNGTLRTDPFLNITSKISSTNVEEGFLGFCFSPNYKNNGKFYVSYTDSVGSQLYSVIEQYTVSAGDTNLADPATALPIISVLQPFQNHNGGNIFFGPDGDLYIFWGDGGSGGDPFNNAQNKTVLLGKILRIDVDNASMVQPYAIPPTNPFYDSTGGIRREIWAYGLRNPWRNSFDRITNDLWIADVGQGAREEIDFQPAGLDSGRDYGWRRMEGVACYNPSSNCQQPGFILPIHDYDHTVGYSITGGNVYRSIQSRDIWGIYLYSDYGAGWIDGFRQNNGAVSGSVMRLLNYAGGGPISFGEDRYGELYLLLNGNGTVYKIEDANPNRFPKAYFTATGQNVSAYLLQAAQGRNTTYQWLFNNNPIPGATNPSYLANQNGQYKLVVTNSLTNSDTSAIFAVSALPVTLKDFTGRNAGNNTILLTWKTASEQYNRGFEMERKLPEETGFRQIAFLSSGAPNGNASAELDYFYVDTVLYKGTIQYRLKQINLDGSSVYSRIVLVNTSSGRGFAILIAPNPASGVIRITTSLNDHYQYQLTDANGKLMMKNSFSGITHELSTQSLRNGIYYLRIQASGTGETVIEKLMIYNH